VTTPLLDKIRAGDPRAPWFIRPENLAAWRGHRDRMLGILREPQLPAFNVAQVAKYYYETSNQEYWNLDNRSSFPTLQPPYDLCWMEHQFPERIHSEIGDQDVTHLGGGDAGFLMMCADRSGVVGQGIPETMKRLLVCEVFIHYGFNGKIFGPHGTWTIALDERGAIIDNPCMQGWHDSRHDEDMKLYQGWLNVPLLAISGLPVAGLRGPVRTV
jgi:hypothetical protein